MDCICLTWTQKCPDLGQHMQIELSSLAVSLPAPSSLSVDFPVHRDIMGKGQGEGKGLGLGHICLWECHSSICLAVGNE